MAVSTAYPCSETAKITWEYPPKISFSDPHNPGTRTFVVTWTYDVICRGRCVKGDWGCWGGGTKEVPVPVPLKGNLTSGPFINDLAMARRLGLCFKYLDKLTWEECLEKHGNGSKPANVIKKSSVDASKPKPKRCWCTPSRRRDLSEIELGFIEQKRYEEVLKEVIKKEVSKGDNTPFEFEEGHISFDNKS